MQQPNNNDQFKLMAESTKRFLKDTLESFFDYWIQIQSHLMKESELSS